MLVSRGLAAVRAARFLRNRSAQPMQAIRNSHAWNYRCAGPPASKNVLLAAEVVSGIAWWWVLWHCVTEPDHILGEFGPYLDPTQWTDEELGIPPVDE